MSTYTGLLVSQIGYDLGYPMRVLVRGGMETLPTEGATFDILSDSGTVSENRPVQYWGTIWGSHWWVADFSHLTEAGDYQIVIHDNRHQEQFCSEIFPVATDLLWEQTWKTVALDQNERRANLAMNKVGWQDCGSVWQEANSHAGLIIGLTDLLEFASDRMETPDRERSERQIINGCDYLLLLQARAKVQGFGTGAVSHQTPKYEEVVLPQDVAMAVISFARAARLLSDSKSERKATYSAAAAAAHQWLLKARPLRDWNREPGFSTINNGAPADFQLPDEWMTRDLLLHAWAAYETAELQTEEAHRTELLAHTANLLSQIMQRQVPVARAEGDFYGHFYTFASTEFTEKAWIHNIETRTPGVDAGGHFPHYVLPFLWMLRAVPDHPDAEQWTTTLHNFAYGYFLPACRANPFYLLPLGFFNQANALLWFAGLWHGMNTVYGLAAAMATEFETFFGDVAFREITAGNLQWIAGLNSGLTADGMYASHMFSTDVPDGVALPVSMIHGFGRHFAGTWLNVRGSICNGFSTGQQFRFDVQPTVENDGPFTFTDEDWITHSGAWISALVRLKH